MGMDAPALEKPGDGITSVKRGGRRSEERGMNVKKAGFLIGGSVLLVTGLVLILAWWPRVVDLFKGGIGMVLALTGLVVLALVRD